MEDILTVKQLRYTYADGTEALKDLEFTIKRGEKIAVLGSNGSGKSTLFLCLNGVLRASGGEILFQQKPLKYDRKSLLEIRKNIGIVFQDPETQLFCADVFQEVAFGPLNLKYSKEKLKEVVEQSLSHVDISHLRQKPPHFLSYGQKKRVSIASILSMDPQVIIFDEPTSALDPFHGQQIIDLMEQLHQQGKTLIMSTHDIQMAYSWADRVILLSDGEILANGSPAEILSDEALMDRGQLQIPTVLRLFKKMVKCGVLPEDLPLPKTVDDLEACLEQYVRRV